MPDWLGQAGRSTKNTVTGTFRFNGRSRVAEGLWYFLALSFVRFVASLLVDPLPWNFEWMVKNAVVVATSLPVYALLARRLHDQNLSAWGVLLILPALPMSIYRSYRATFAVVNPTWLDEPAPFADLTPWILAVGLVVIVLFFRPGTHGPNRYGPDPRETASN